MNRRALFTGGSALALATLPKSARAVCALAPAGQDAEIIHLGDEHDRLRALWVSAFADARRAEDDALDLFDAHGGGDYKARFAFVAALPAQRLIDHCEALADQLNDVDEAIRSSQPKTAAGWLVRLRVERDDHIPPWDAREPVDKLEWPAACLCQLYDGFAAFVAAAR